MAQRRSVSLCICLGDVSLIDAHGLLKWFGRDEVVAEDEPNLPTLFFILCSFVPHINITLVRLVQNLPKTTTNLQQRLSIGQCVQILPTHVAFGRILATGKEGTGLIVRLGVVSEQPLYKVLHQINRDNSQKAQMPNSPSAQLRHCVEIR